jgi:hypothetical protein
MSRMPYYTVYTMEDEYVEGTTGTIPILFVHTWSTYTYAAPRQLLDTTDWQKHRPWLQLETMIHTTGLRWTLETCLRNSSGNPWMLALGGQAGWTLAFPLFMSSYRPQWCIYCSHARPFARIEGGGG